MAERASAVLWWAVVGSILIASIVYAVAQFP
jgi:hypothetical protein